MGLKAVAGTSFANPTFTGVASFADGTASLPSIAFTSTPATGIYLPTGGAGPWLTRSGAGAQAGVSASGVFSALAGLGLASAATTAPHFIISAVATGSGGVTTGRWSVKQGAAVASANDLTLGSDGNRFQITGTTTINRILNTGWQGGSIVTLHFQGSLTVTNGSASGSNFQLIRLAGAANFSATANDQLTLQYDSTAAEWFEIARCVI